MQITRRTRDEIEVALLAFELTERRVALVLSVAMAIVAVLCALRGSPWPLPAGTGLAAVGFGAVKQSRRAGEHDHGEGLQCHSQPAVLRREGSEFRREGPEFESLSPRNGQ